MELNVAVALALLSMIFMVFTAVDASRLSLAASKRITALEQETARLKAGRFTEEEFQNLCHGFDESDFCRFKRGCEEYQRKLFGDKACLSPSSTPKT